MKEYFSFTKKERVGVIALVVVVLSAYFLPYFFKPEYKQPSAKEIAEFKKLQQLIKPDSIAESRPPPAQLFYFDPNTLSAGGWTQLGLRAKTIGTILKFVSKGGRFYEAADLKKIYGLHADEFERLERYVRISKPAVKTYAEQPRSFVSTNAPVKKFNTDKKTIIDINQADTSAFIALPGIGSKLAARIILFREKLGGFYSIDQVAETYGLPDSTFQKIRALLSLNDPQPHKVNINTATLDVLRQHPYIRGNLANAIIRYRDQHGPFKLLEDLQQIAVITPEVYRKIFPYLALTAPE